MLSYIADITVGKKTGTVKSRETWTVFTTKESSPSGRWDQEKNSAKGAKVNISFYYIPTINTVDFTLVFYNEIRPTDFTTNKIYSCITSSVCKSVSIHTRKVVLLIC